MRRFGGSGSGVAPTADGALCDVSGTQCRLTAQRIFLFLSLLSLALSLASLLFWPPASTQVPSLHSSFIAYQLSLRILLILGKKKYQKIKKPPLFSLDGMQTRPTRLRLEEAEGWQSTKNFCKKTSKKKILIITKWKVTIWCQRTFLCCSFLPFNELCEHTHTHTCVRAHVSRRSCSSLGL